MDKFQEDFLNKILNPVTLTVNWDEVDKIPEFKKLHSAQQNPYYHGEGNAFIHTQNVVSSIYELCPIENSDCLSSIGEAHERYFKRLILVLSALFHDIGKGETTRWDKASETWKAPYHAQKSQKIARRLLWDWHMPYREMVCSLVGNHMKPLYIHEKENKVREVIKLAEEIVPLDWLLTLKYADCCGSLMKEYDGWKEKLEEVRNIAKEYNCLYNRYEFTDGESRYHYFNSTANLNEPLEVKHDENYGKFSVIFLIGLPGSGKTTVRDKFGDLPIICRDDIRKEIGLKGEKPQGNKEQEEEVTRIQNERFMEYTEQKQSFVIDATNLRKEFRNEFRNMLYPYNAEIIYYYIEAPTYEETLNRRKGMIQPEIIEKMRKNFDFPKLSECCHFLINKQGLEWFNEFK